MPRIFLFIICIALGCIINAQSFKKNSIKPIGFFTDQALFFNDPTENNSNGNAIEYDRLISPHISIGIIYFNYWNLKDDYKYFELSDYMTQINSPGYNFYSAKFNAKVDGLLISSKYCFNDADLEGQHSFYVGSEVGAFQINARLHDIQMKSATNQNLYTSLDDRTQKLYVSKLGGKFGYSGSAKYLSSDISLSFCKNTIISSEEWSLPFNLKNWSLQFTWLIGFNF